MNREKYTTLLLTIIALLLAANLFSSVIKNSAQVQAQAPKPKVQYDLIVQGRARTDTIAMLNQLADQGWRVRGFAMDGLQHHFLIER